MADLGWVNMGHTTVRAVEKCSQMCKHPSNQSKPSIVIGVRNPYALWRSYFRYAWIGRCNGWHRPRTEDFESFMHWVNETGQAGQSDHLREACGSPCQYDFVIHTESMSDDFEKLFDQLGLPRRQLEHINPTDEAAPADQFFSKAILEIIHRIDGTIFDEFKYSKHTLPFHWSEVNLSSLHAGS
eukprot:gnl/TRDRNA2_/TRDRNA2_117666_c1_seq1.p1 gnl/TRDRNA2_/TRDRNA2_117666_c1~~gnl/TRDRNA2_/TRDRNA2_117666_c1_seq1.p1  ORF type:complete len:194 (-),score=1.50 gnl/TRDRNA2_/TRDRNA2_117666_c1_seq1:121-672(-)